MRQTSNGLKYPQAVPVPWGVPMLTSTPVVEMNELPRYKHLECAPLIPKQTVAAEEISITFEAEILCCQ